MNTMPYDHPLDRQGHITSALYFSVAAYFSYIGLIASGILFLQKKETGHGFDELHYFDVVRTMPHPDTHSIWGSLHFLPLVSNVFLSHYDSGTSCPTLQQENMNSTLSVCHVSTYIKCT